MAVPSAVHPESESSAAQPPSQKLTILRSPRHEPAPPTLTMPGTLPKREGPRSARAVGVRIWAVAPAGHTAFPSITRSLLQFRAPKATQVS